MHGSVEPFQRSKKALLVQRNGHAEVDGPAKVGRALGVIGRVLVVDHVGAVEDIGKGQIKDDRTPLAKRKEVARLGV